MTYIKQLFSLRKNITCRPVSTNNKQRMFVAKRRINRCALLHAFSSELVAKGKIWRKWCKLCQVHSISDISRTHALPNALSTRALMTSVLPLESFQMTSLQKSHSSFSEADYQNFMNSEKGEQTKNHMSQSSTSI